MLWSTEFLTENLGLHAHIVKLAASLIISGGIGAAILWGWGFDSHPT